MSAGCPDRLRVGPHPGRWNAKQVFGTNWPCERWCCPWQVIGLDKLQGLAKPEWCYKSIRNVGLEWGI